MSASGGNGFQWTPEFWQKWRESESKYRQYKSARDRSLAMETLQLQDGERVLEVGCGYGWISQALVASAQIEWFGVDRSPEMIRSLRSNGFSFADRSFIGDACRLPFPDGLFDKVLCSGVLMHIAEDDAAIAELVRVTRPGGMLVCTINNFFSPYAWPARLWNRRKKAFVQKFRRPRAIQNLLRANGIKVDWVAGDGIFATVPLNLGRLHFPPQSCAAAVEKWDERIVNRFPSLAYEVWLRGRKAQ